MRTVAPSDFTPSNSADLSLVEAFRKGVNDGGLLEGRDGGEEVLGLDQVRLGCVFERGVVHERAHSRIDQLLLGLTDYASLVEAIGLYEDAIRVVARVQLGRPQ
jgi:hypothetical protein